MSRSLKEKLVGKLLSKFLNWSLVRTLEEPWALVLGFLKTTLLRLGLILTRRYLEILQRFLRKNFLLRWRKIVIV